MKAIDLIQKYEPCKRAIDWLGDRSVEQMVNECERGDWLLWLAKKMGLDFRPLTLAKARCAKTVIHLMKDKRSIKAVEVAESFGNGLADRWELDAAAANAANAAAYAADARKQNQKQTADICREEFGK